MSPLWSVCGFPTQLPTCHYFVTGDANVQIASISEELAKKTEDAARQQEEITHLLSQIVDLQKKAKSVRLLCLWMTRQWPCGDGTDGQWEDRSLPEPCILLSGGGLVRSGANPAAPRSAEASFTILLFPRMIYKLAAFIEKCCRYGVLGFI